MILGIIYETISNTPVGYVLRYVPGIPGVPGSFAITLYSTDGYRHIMSNYKTRHVRYSGFHKLMDKSTPMRYETE